MRGIRRQHNRPARGFHAHHLQSVGMAADAMHRHPGRDLAVAGVEGDALAIDMADHGGDVLDRERMPQHAVAHAAPGRVAHLAVLQVKARVGEAIEIAGVVVVQMGDDDVLDAGGGNAEIFQRVDRIEGELAGARLGLFGVEAGVDQDVATAAAHQPDEIIEIRCRGLMRIGGQKIHVGGARRHGCIAQRVDLVGISHRCHFSWMSGLGRCRQQAIVIRKGQTRPTNDSRAMAQRAL